MPDDEQETEYEVLITHSVLLGLTSWKKETRDEMVGFLGYLGHDPIAKTSPDERSGWPGKMVRTAPFNFLFLVSITVSYEAKTVTIIDIEPLTTISAYL